ncbi:MAG TPA: ABC transporter substrate-binding protein [Methylibium sp.]|uniref:ABC transporter substrate-binding protein n=1 Tax=Methylibium sp. TaxID=2067992 RepID=UPI002DBF0254|nr:ABC transporter substrate-binding protein [Methylibium sp.]HEU4458928.1 ABC transporter substrate-binding protein [Methylibium sp.]
MQRRQFMRRVARGAGITAASIARPLFAQADKRLLLGQSCALTGPAGELGTQFQRGARLYFDRLNQRGGFGGRTIELRTVDDGYEPDRCQENTDKLLRADVFALFGYVGTPTGLAALPLASAARVPFFAPFTGAQALRDPFNRYAFHVRASYFDETARIVNQLTTLGTRRIAVFHQNDSYGKAGLEGVSRALKPNGLAPIATATVERNAVEVAEAVKTLLAAGPEAIVQISAYKSCAAFIRAARAAGYTRSFYNVSFVGTQALSRELGAEAHGVIVSQVMPYPFTPASALAAEYLGAGQGVTGFEPNYSSIEGYVAAKVFAEGLKRASGAGREDLVNGLETLRDHDLGGFFVDFNPRKHTGSSFAEMTLLDREGRVRR